MSIQKSKRTLLEEISDLMHREHYSLSTERTYCDWIRKFVKFHQMQAREALFVDQKKVEDFLNYLAIERNVAVSTQNQAFNALVFLYKRVLKSPFENVKAVRSHKEAQTPVVLTHEEVKQVLSLLDGVPELVVKLLYDGLVKSPLDGKIQSDLGVIKPFDTLVPFNTRCSEYPIFSSS